MGNSQRNSDSWLLTYSDFVTLLLVFFVMLYMLTPGIDESTFNDFISYFQTSEGIMDQNAVVNDNTSTLREEWEKLKKFLEERGVSSQVDIKKIPQGVKVTLSDSLTFNSGSAKLLPKARTVLNEISGIFDEDIQGVKVQGHTDNVPIAATSAYRSNWHLGAARAVSVVLFIRDKTILPPAKFEASSFGEYKPVATNSTPEGRRQNRRIEMYVHYKDNNDSSTTGTASVTDTSFTEGIDTEPQIDPELINQN